MRKSILISGANGFIGSALIKNLKQNNKFIITGLHRKPPKSHDNNDNNNLIIVNDLVNADLSQALNGKSVVIHTAARAHIMHDKSENPLKEYRRVNVNGTINIAKQAIDAGVKRFIFLSSIKVNGESTSNRPPFSENDKESPKDAYGISKYEAEIELLKLTKNTDMEVVIIRLPLVYGYAVKGNFLNLIKLANKRIPLPFGSIDNKRSMIYLGNLIDFIILCIEHPKAVNQTFLVSDHKDISLKKLIKYIRTALGLPSLLLPVPTLLFKLIGKLTGKDAVIDRLVGNLQVDSTKAQTTLDWQPPFTTQQGIEQTILDFKNEDK